MLMMLTEGQYKGMLANNSRATSKATNYGESTHCTCRSKKVEPRLLSAGLWRSQLDGTRGPSASRPGTLAVLLVGSYSSVFI